MTENYFYYDPTSDCNTCISQYDYDRLSEKDKQKYQRLDGSPNRRVYIDKENLIAENQRLKAQLNKEIHYNRKMKRALEQIASENDCYLTIADKVLKEIDNKE